MKMLGLLLLFHFGLAHKYIRHKLILKSFISLAFFICYRDLRAI